MQQAVASPTLTIGQIEGASSGAGVDILEVMIAALALFMNVGKTFTQVQVRETARLLISDPEAKNLKPEDFYVMFNNAKKGVYGPLYDRLDGNIIFGWKNAYMAERMDYCEQQNINVHGQKIKSPDLIHPEIVNMYKEMLKQRPDEPTKVPASIRILEDKPGYEVDWKDANEQQRKKNRKIQRSPRDQFIQDCFTEHYKIWLKNPYKGKKPQITHPGVMDGGETPGRFILFSYIKNGKEVVGPVDEVEYAAIKVAEFDRRNEVF